MINLDDPMMIRELWNSFIIGLNLLLPLRLPDGTEIGAWIILGLIGIILAVFAGWKAKREIDKLKFDL